MKWTHGGARTMKAREALRPAVRDYARPEDLFAFTEKIFVSRLPLGVRPTLRDLAYLRTDGERFVEPGAYGHARGAERDCFGNAYRAVDADPSLTYVQGLVRGRSDFVYPHAWCVDDRGRLIELTWDCTASTGYELYFGVRFKRHQLAALIVHYGGLDWFEGFSLVIGAESADQTMAER